MQLDFHITFDGYATSYKLLPFRAKRFFFKYIKLSWLHLICTNFLSISSPLYVLIGTIKRNPPRRPLKKCVFVLESIFCSRSHITLFYIIVKTLKSRMIKLQSCADTQNVCAVCIYYAPGSQLGWVLDTSVTRWMSVQCAFTMHQDLS